MTLSDDSRRQRQPRGPGRPTAITTEQIAAAALDIGFRELTFAGVAERLGVGQATLYRHVPNRDELVRLGLDLAIRRVSWPDLNGPWRPLLERWSLASWHAWAAFPGAVIEATRGVIPPSLVRLSIQVGTALVERGFTPRDAVLAADLVFDLAVDSRRGVEALELTLESQSAPLRQTMEHNWTTPETTGGTTNPDREVRIAAQLRDEMVHAIREDPERWFTGKLTIALSGIEHELAPSSTQQEQK